MYETDIFDGQPCIVAIKLFFVFFTRPREISSCVCGDTNPIFFDRRSVVLQLDVLMIPHDNS